MHNLFMNPKDALAAWLAKTNTNPTELSKRVSGLNQPTVFRILSGETPDPRTSTLKKLASALGITYEEFLAGPTEGNSDTAPRPVRVWSNDDELELGDVLIPALELNLSAGPGETVWHVDEKGRRRVFQADYLNRLGVKHDCAATMTVKGTSMEPRLWDGDSVLVDYCRQALLDGKVYAVVWQGEYFIKRVFKEAGGSIRLVSDNTDKINNPDKLIPADHLDELQIIGRVVGIVGGRL